MLLPIIIMGLIFGLIGGAYLTNPFNRITVVRRPFVVRALVGSFQAINHNHRLHVEQAWYWRWFAVLKAFVHILHTRWVHSPRARGQNVDEIIASIYKRRFNPDRLLLTSGDHFSSLFVRNLGVFYYPVLDGRIPGSQQDWENRQTVYLQTLAYALGVFAKRPIPATTLVATGAYRVTCINYHAYPSDTVYGVLYALAALRGDESGAPSDYAAVIHKPHTKTAARILLAEYRDTLVQLYDHYRRTAFDPDTGLVRLDVHMSGAKDITRRCSAFYDNVVFWKTTQLAARLGLIPKDISFLAKLKNRILQTFWLEEEGYFLEDLSEEGKRHNYYSSDWLFVLASGFLDPANARERAYFERSIKYIQAQKIDQPLPIKYQHERRAHRQFWIVRLTMASYGGTAVWSFWGMEYIKTLLILFQHTGRPGYLAAAEKHIAGYKRIMVREGGFPEVLDQKGNLMETPFYRSIRQTGWVIGFDQVRALHTAVKSLPPKGGR